MVEHKELFTDILYKPIDKNALYNLLHNILDEINP